MNLEQADVFGVLRSLSDNAAECLTYAQYTALVLRVTTQLGMDEATARYTFNVETLSPVVGAASDGSQTASIVNPPCCAHLDREGATEHTTHPEAIPTALCLSHEAEEEKDCQCVNGVSCSMLPKPHEGPHVHCLRCLHVAAAQAPLTRGGVPLPATVQELSGSGACEGMWRHHEDHRLRRNKYLSLIDEVDEENEDAYVKYVGDSASDLDLDTDEGVEACERIAEEAGRHSCFSVSSGATACPVVVAFCSICQQLAPLVHFVYQGDSVDSGGGGVLEDEEAVPNNKKGLVPVAEQWVSTDDINMVMSRVLLGCHIVTAFLQASTQHEKPRFSAAPRGQLDGHCAAGSLAASEDPSDTLLFVFKPSLFDEEDVDDYVLTDAFEDGVECTHGTAVLPWARVVGAPSHPKLALDHCTDTVEALCPVCELARNSTPPYTFGEVVIGFLMQWNTAAEVEERVQMVLKHDMVSNNSAGSKAGFRVTRRPVYVEDTQQWVLARVLYHQSVAAGPEVSTYYDAADPTESVRTARDYVVQTPFPLNVRARFVRLCNDAEGGHISQTQAPAPLSSSSLVAAAAAGGDGDAELDGCPFSMEARTINFFTSMTAIARAMHEVALFFNQDSTTPDS